MTGSRSRNAVRSQEEAASNPEYGSEFKGQLSKAEKQQKRKAILSAIGVCPAPATELALAGYICTKCMHQVQDIRLKPDVKDPPATF